MAAKNYMTDWEGLRNALESSGSTKWILSRGFNSNNSQRTQRIYKQDNVDLSIDQSFDDLKQRIIWNAGGGGDFSIYLIDKSSNHGDTIWFRVEGANTQPAIAGYGNMHPAQMGWVSPMEMETQRRLWELERENEELNDAINGPNNFLQTMLAGLVSDGTVQEAIKGLVDLSKVYLQNKMMGNQGARVSLNGYPNQTPTEPVATEDYEYQDAAFDFLDSVRASFNGNEQAFYTFLDDLRTVYENNPQGSVTMIQFQANQLRQSS